MNLNVAPVRQRVSMERVADPAAEVRAGLRALPLSDHVKPGMRIAVGVGSRGISCIYEIVKTVIDELHALNAEPFLVPAMGSHGGGTAEGQREVLESYGLRPDILKAPIHTSMDAVLLGQTDEGIAVYFDTHAVKADGIIIINRIKEHTAFKGNWESGLMKMLAVGLGKAQGAAELHNKGIRDAFPKAARYLIDHMPIIAGVGIVENGQHEPARIAVLPAKQIEAEEAKLLTLARQFLPRIPAEFFPIDLLILREIGKDISGTGMDLNIVGMWRRNGGPIDPPIDRLVVLDLTPNSHGNAIGIGYADVIPQRLRDKVDWQATYTNCISSHNWAGGRAPITLPTDQDAIATGLAGIDPATVRLLLVRNTLEMEVLWVSEALLKTVPANPLLEQIGPLRPLAFDADGNLIMPEIA
jgi:hypothetical protein